MKLVITILTIILFSCSKEEITEPINNNSPQYTQSLTYAVDSFTHTWKLVKTDTTRLHYHSLEENELSKYRNLRDTVCGSFKIGYWIISPDYLMHKK